MSEINLSAVKRPGKGKQEAKHFRKEGMTPGVLYGSGMDSTAIALNTKELLSLLHAHGRNKVVNLTVKGSKTPLNAFIYDLQHHPITGEVIHLDLKKIVMTEKIHVNVPVHLKGTSYGVKNEGGIVEHIQHTLEITSLPTDIPESIEIDISDMHLGDVVHVSDIEGYEFLADPESVVVHIVAPKLRVEEEVAAEEEPSLPELVGEEEKEEE